MWFYTETFRLFAILFFMFTWNNIVELQARDARSIIDDNDSAQEDDGENIIPNLPNGVVFIDRNGKINYEGLSDLLNQEVYKIRVVKDLEIQKVLRGQYVDACIKVVIRKCYKAMLNVLKNLCKFTFRCKRDFKDDFKEESKKVCINEFDYSKFYNTTIKLRNTPKDDMDDEYKEKCIPIMARKLQSQSKKNKKNNNFKTKSVPHIFRKSHKDMESDRECQKISRNKCVYACQCVRKKLCSVHECGGRKRRLFKKICKDSCQREYRVERVNKDSSDTDE